MSTASATPVTVTAIPTLDAGIVGEIPSEPGVFYFPEAGGYRNFVKLLFLTAGFFVVLGLAMMIAVGGPSWLFLLLSFPFVLWGLDRRKRQLHMDCVCDERGLTLRMSKGSTPQRPVFIRWALVQKTHCGKMVTTSVDLQSGLETSREYLTFHINAPGSGAVQIEETRVKNLAGIIALANQNTPQLEYVWLPAGQVGQRKVLAKTGKYWMVAR